MAMDLDAPQPDVAMDQLLALLVGAGAGRRAHAHGRTLLDHLVGTRELLRRWDQPVWLQAAALVHSVYGTDVYRPRVLGAASRQRLVELAGERAERLAFLFSTVPRSSVFAAARELPDEPRGWVGREHDTPTREQLSGLLILHMANLAEQAQAADGSPGLWLSQFLGLRAALARVDVAVPPCLRIDVELEEHDEHEAREAYLSGIARLSDPTAAAVHLGRVATACPMLAEPCVWLAYLALSQGDSDTASWWARRARVSLRAFGTPWDKRLSLEEWLRVAELLESGSAASPAPGARSCGRAPAAAEPGRDGDHGRFTRYLASFASRRGDPQRRVYPGLETRPWFDPAEIPLAAELERDSEIIREQVLALGGGGFHREAEDIRRSGAWDVLFFYERGRRRDEHCRACPAVADAIERHATMRTVTGLAYVSRLRGNTHIAAHRSVTNLRVRCHLGITVPEGDCAIRVGGETRGWQEGRCLVFDDRFDHEAWNHTHEDRIVLVIDLWHPALSRAEIDLLEGMHRYAYAYARELDRYWRENAAAARS